MKKIALLIVFVGTLLFCQKNYAQCDAIAGLPVAPLTEFDQCTQAMEELAVQSYTAEAGGSTDYTLAVTYIAPDSTYSSWNAPILGVSADGTYDFCGKPLGQYCFHSFSYNQAELDSITNSPTIQALASCLTGNEPLEEILSCVEEVFGFATIDAAIDSVLSKLVPLLVPAFEAPNDPPCYQIVPEGMEYCIDLTCAMDAAMCTVNVAEYFNNTWQVSQAPNPFSKKTIITYTTKTSGFLDFKVYTNAGSLVYEDQLKSVIGKNSYEFTVGNLKDGFYFYTIGNEAHATPNKMVIKR